jgi:hypothetical protein
VDVGQGACSLAKTHQAILSAKADMIFVHHTRGTDPVQCILAKLVSFRTRNEKKHVRPGMNFVGRKYIWFGSPVLCFASIIVQWTVCGRLTDEPAVQKILRDYFPSQTAETAMRRKIFWILMCGAVTAVPKV